MAVATHFRVDVATSELHLFFILLDVTDPILRRNLSQALQGILANILLMNTRGLLYIGVGECVQVLDALCNKALGHIHQTINTQEALH